VQQISAKINTHGLSRGSYSNSSFPLLKSCVCCHYTYLRMSSSFIPIVDTKSHGDHIAFSSQHTFPKHGNFFLTGLAVMPLIPYTILHTAHLGEIIITTWIGSVCMMNGVILHSSNLPSAREKVFCKFAPQNLEYITSLSVSK
jgi:hypothetical protein